MPALDEVLSGFADAIVHGGQPTAQMETHYPLPSPLPQAGEGGKESLRDINYSIDVAINVYRNNYHGNLHDALAGAYPVIEQLVGADFFRLLTRTFIERHGSASGNLHRYGAEMADFIAAFEPAQGLPYLPDVAALEWACHCAYFADDAAALDLARLAQVTPEHYADLLLHLHPSSHLLRCRYPAAAIWHAHQPGAGSDFHIDLDRGPCNALVSRQDDAVLVSELSAADAAWLQAIQAGATLGEATDKTLQHHPGFDLQSALLNLVARNVFAGFSLAAAS